MPVTICLIVANAIVFAVYLFQSSFAGLLSYDGPVLFKMGAAFGPSILVLHQYWRLPASIFLHANLAHLFLNMFSLFIFGRMLEKPMGSPRFFVLYCFAGLFGGLASLGAHRLEESVGASGAILGLVGFYVYLQLRSDRANHPGVGYRLRQAIGLSLALYGLSLTPGVDNAAHLGGLVAGIVCGIAFQRLADLTVKWSRADLVITAALAALFVAMLYAEQIAFSNDNEVKAAVLLHDTTDCLRRNDLNGALINIDSALKIDPKNEQSLLLRSAIKQAVDQYPQALADASEAVAVAPDHGPAYAQRASVYLALARYDEALADARAALKHDPHLTVAMDNEAMALAYMGQLDQAVVVLNGAIDADGGASGLYFYHRSLIYSALGDSAKADADMRQANKHAFNVEDWERSRPLPKSMLAP